MNRPLRLLNLPDRDRFAPIRKSGKMLVPEYVREKWGGVEIEDLV